MPIRRSWTPKPNECLWYDIKKKKKKRAKTLTRLFLFRHSIQQHNFWVYNLNVIQSFQRIVYFFFFSFHSMCVVYCLRSALLNSDRALSCKLYINIFMASTRHKKMLTEPSQIEAKKKLWCLHSIYVYSQYRCDDKTFFAELLKYPL